MPPNRKPSSLLTGFDADYNFVGNDGTQFYFLTDNEAPRRKLIAIDIASPSTNIGATLIPQTDEIRTACFAGE